MNTYSFYIVRRLSYLSKPSLIAFICLLFSFPSYSQSCGSAAPYTNVVYNPNPCGTTPVVWSAAPFPATATMPQLTNYYTDYMDIASFTFPLASALPLTGITICIQGSSGSTNVRIEGVQLLQSGVPVGTVMGPIALSTTANTWYAFGGCTNTWGTTTLTPTNLGVRIWLGENCGAGPPLAVLATIDDVKAIVYQTSCTIITASPCAPCNTVLPIQLVSFTAKPSGEQVDLSWTTGSEVENSYFTIERSADAQNWGTVITVPGAGNSDYPISYAAIDKTPFSGTSYYRLKQTDYDGNSTNSDIVPVTVTEPAGQMLIYPNPATNKIYCNIPTGNPGMQTVRIIDITGRVIMNTEMMVSESGQIELNTANLQPGIYFAEVNNGGQILRQTFIKQ